MKNTFAVRSTFAVVLTGIVFAAPLFSAAPGKIAYQGKVTDSGGTPWPDATYDFNFKIYSAASGGTALQERPLAIPTKSGVFNVILDYDPVHFQTYPTIYLEVIAEGNSFGRQQLVAAPYSLAVAAGSVGPTELRADAVTASKIANDAVTADKLATMTLPDDVIASSVAVNKVGTTQIVNDAVTALKIANGAVTKAKILSSDLTATLYLTSDSRLVTGTNYDTVICTTTATGAARFRGCDGSCPTTNASPVACTNAAALGRLVTP